MNNQLSDLINILKGNPQTMYDKLMKENPQFSEFVSKNKDKNPNDIAKEYGIDPIYIKRNKSTLIIGKIQTNVWYERR